MFLATPVIRTVERIEFPSTLVQRLCVESALVYAEAPKNRQNYLFVDLGVCFTRFKVDDMAPELIRKDRLVPFRQIRYRVSVNFQFAHLADSKLAEFPK